MDHDLATQEVARADLCYFVRSGQERFCWPSDLLRHIGERKWALKDYRKFIERDVTAAYGHVAGMKICSITR